jgi:hypothetical protein
MARKKVNIDLDKFHYHEALDRLSVVMDNIDRSLLQHPVCKIETEVKEKVAKGLETLWEAYQLVSEIRFKENNMKTYSIRITPIVNEETSIMGRGDAPFHISLDTNDIERSMEQWGRNRRPFKYEILEELNAQDD